MCSYGQTTIRGYKCSKSCSAKKKKLSRTLTLTKIFPIHNPHHARDHPETAKSYLNNLVTLYLWFDLKI